MLVANAPNANVKTDSYTAPDCSITGAAIFEQQVLCSYWNEALEQVDHVSGDQKQQDLI
jgi:hypothetical protein